MFLSYIWMKDNLKNLWRNVKIHMHLMFHSRYFNLNVHFSANVKIRQHLFPNDDAKMLLVHNIVYRYKIFSKNNK